ncbi:MAG: hypothetical protein AAGA16_11965 [Cyanobacteria bacterium P01_E01_bin.35]
MIFPIVIELIVLYSDRYPASSYGIWQCLLVGVLNHNASPKINSLLI